MNTLVMLFFGMKINLIQKAIFPYDFKFNWYANNLILNTSW